MRRYGLGGAVAGLGSIVAILLTVIATAPAVAGDAGHAYRQLVPDRNGQAIGLFAEEFGQGPPIVLLHGLGGSTYVWRFVMPALARTNRVIAIDLKGFGRSDKPFDDAYGTVDHARLVLAFLKQRRLTNVTLVGHSFGGLVALLVTMSAERSAPQLVRRLVLFNTPAFPQAPSQAVALLQKPVLPYVVLTIVPPEVQAAIALFTEAIGMDHITSKDVKFYAAPLREAGGRHALIETARLLQPANSEAIIARYPTLRTRTTIVACRDDQTIPLSTATRLARLLPRTRLEVIDGCDHIPPEQTPDKVVEAIRRAR